MLTETGRVVAVEEDGLWVETIRQSTCGSCSAQKGCGHGLLNQMGNGRSHYLRVLMGDQEPHTYQVDDEVEIAIPEQVILQGSLIVYVLPLVAMLAGTILGQWLWPGADVAAIAGAVAGFAAGVGLVRLHAQRHRDDENFQPRLLRPLHAAVLVDAAKTV